MATKKQQESIYLYAGLMEEAKIRIACIDGALSGRIAALPGPVIREFCYLQFRMLCELIALGCLTAHGDIQATQTKKLRKEWSPERIIAQLEALHPHFYPQPARSTFLPSGYRQFLPLHSGFLTKGELLALNGKCGDVLHRGGLKKFLSPRTPVQTNFPDVAEWRRKIGMLLDLHIIFLIDGKTRFICMLRNESDNNRVQVAILETIEGLPPYK
jgi:hypothetical protein